MKGWEDEEGEMRVYKEEGKQEKRMERGRAGLIREGKGRNGRRQEGKKAEGRRGGQKRGWLFGLVWFAKVGMVWSRYWRRTGQRRHIKRMREMVGSFWMGH